MKKLVLLFRIIISSSVMAKTVRENLIGLHYFVTAHQIHLIDQLYEAFNRNYKGVALLFINWNEKSKSHFLLVFRMKGHLSYL